MCGDVRRISKETYVDGFEGIKWSWPKQQAYLVYCNVMRCRFTLIITMHKGTHEFTYVNR